MKGKGSFKLFVQVNFVNLLTISNHEFEAVNLQVFLKYS